MGSDFVMEGGVLEGEGGVEVALFLSLFIVSTVDDENSVELMFDRVERRVKVTQFFDFLLSSNYDL